MRLTVHSVFLVKIVVAACLISGFFIPIIHAQEGKPPFFPDARYASEIPTPAEVIGFLHGDRPARYDEAVRYFKTLAERSPRVLMFESGSTHENRTLYYLIISSGENIGRIENIKKNLSYLSDPRTLSSEDTARDIIKTSPIVVWMMYSVHGDELSGVDASLQLAYHLAAGTDSTTVGLLDKVIVGIDPMENPDGRERFLAQMKVWNGVMSSTDGQSIQHTGVWPWGRTNHYLFDMNRDWFILSQPESRARVKTLLEWNPQVVVDAHEMGMYDTYFFNPPREPINPHINKTIRDWWRVFAAEQSQAFDRYGWSYYTREWADDWYPGYGESWPYFTGAVGILYEQAQTDGSQVKRPDGTMLTFREAVHHQFISSLANITTAARNSTALLGDYYSSKKEAVSPPSKGEIRAYYIDPGVNPSRARRLVERLLIQGIEVDTAQENFQLKNCMSFRDSLPVTKTLPKGTYIINLSQPLRPLINAILEFDPRMSTAFLRTEREHLEKGKGTQMYEVSAWSMLLAYDVDACVSPEAPPGNTARLKGMPEPEGSVDNPAPAFGFLIDFRDDCAVDALIQLFNRGYTVRSAEKPFRAGGRSFSRGSLLVRLNENPRSVSGEMQAIARSAHVSVYGVDTALSEDGPDLGGNEFRLLTEPRIALLAGPDIDMSHFGALWYLLDYEMKCPHTVIDNNYFDNFDLRKYNVLILPSAGGSPETYKKILGEQDMKKVREWVNNGGTLIGIGAAASFLADSTTAFSNVRLYRQVLKDIDSYREAVLWEEKAGLSVIDSLAVWEGKEPAKTREKDKEKEKNGKPELTADELSDRDAKQRLYMPRGAILRADVNGEHWLGFGAGAQVPAIVYTSYAFLSKNPVETAARFGDSAHLRLSGLLWPEARARWEKTAYVTREASDKGQIILFAGDPDFRSYFYGTARIFLNSILLGPGFGTERMVEW
ncbi:M14 family metallopeptidase [bacterium]|nr:M14 family metallopeptidase [bacterium]